MKNYFAEKERQALLEEERKQQAEAAALMQQQLEAEREKHILEEEAEDAEAKKRAEEIDEEIRNPQILKVGIPLFIYIGVMLCLLLWISNETVIVYVGIGGMMALIVNGIFQLLSIDTKIEKWKKEHPDDPACKFL